MTTYISALQEGSEILKRKKIKSSKLDAEILLSKTLNKNRCELLLQKDFKISEQEKKKFDIFIHRRSHREPVAYITKIKEFFSLNFYVNKSTLIPRPETELIVEKALKIYKNKKPFILDIGAGSGCIIISLLKNLPQSKGFAMDISSNALKVAEKNSQKILKGKSFRLKFIHSNIEEYENKRVFDLIISNPPYIKSNKIKHLDDDIKNFEPKLALDGGKDGLDVIEKVIYKSEKILKLNGLLSLEIGHKQYQLVKKILKKHKFKEIVGIKDLNKKIRFILASLRN